MLCRVADDIFWMSRYVERAIAVGRLIDVVWHFELDAGEHDDTGGTRLAGLAGLPGRALDADTGATRDPGAPARARSVFGAGATGDA